jgi:predicted RNA-binding protein YlqC (UPF0109 family)
MKELVEFFAKCVVTKPDEVVVTEERSEGSVLLKLQVNQEDMGRVIGKQGRVVQAMRTLLRVMAVKQGIRVELVVI